MLEAEGLRSIAKMEGKILQAAAFPSSSLLIIWMFRLSLQNNLYRSTIINSINHFIKSTPDTGPVNPSVAVPAYYTDRTLDIN